jgi:hypothetical protein
MIIATSDVDLCQSNKQNAVRACDTIFGELEDDGVALTEGRKSRKD